MELNDIFTELGKQHVRREDLLRRDRLFDAIDAVRAMFGRHHSAQQMTQAMNDLVDAARNHFAWEEGVESPESGSRAEHGQTRRRIMRTLVELRNGVTVVDSAFFLVRLRLADTLLSAHAFPCAARSLVSGKRSLPATVTPLRQSQRAEEPAMTSGNIQVCGDDFRADLRRRQDGAEDAAGPTWASPAWMDQVAAVLEMQEAIREAKRRTDLDWGDY